MASTLMQYLSCGMAARSKDSASGDPDVQLARGHGDVSVVVDVTPTVDTTKMAIAAADGLTRWRRVT